jgi:hypothetical protein
MVLERYRIIAREMLGASGNSPAQQQKNRSTTIDVSKSKLKHSLRWSGASHGKRSVLVMKRKQEWCN